MPSCTEGYVSKKIDKIMKKQSILEICNIVMQYCRGSLDLDEETIRNYYEVLDFYLMHWIEQTESNPVPYDKLVFSLINSAARNLEFKFGSNYLQSIGIKFHTLQ
jgi:hypothetical protein